MLLKRSACRRGNNGFRRGTCEGRSSLTDAICNAESACQKHSPLRYDSGEGRSSACSFSKLVRGVHAPAADSETFESANERSLIKPNHHDGGLEPRGCRFGEMPTVINKFVTNLDRDQNVCKGNSQSHVVENCTNDNFMSNQQHLHGKFSDCSLISHAAICDRENGISLEQQTSHLLGDVVSHQSRGSDFYENINISDDAGEPLMPRSLVDLAAENFMHEENHQGRLLWQRFKKAAAAGSGVTCESLLRMWVGEGNLVSRPVLLYSILAFWSWKKNKRALELLNWVMAKKPFEIVDMDHAIYIDLVCKTEGFKKAAKYFNQIHKTPQSSMVYSTFLAAYLDHKMEENAKRLFLQARSLIVLPEQTFLFNQFLLFYKDKGRIREVADLLKEMESLGVNVNLSTYNIILDVRARKGDVSGVQSLWKYMEEGTDMKPDAVSYALLAKCYLNVGMFDKAASAIKKLESSFYPNKRALYRWLLKLNARLRREDYLEQVWDKLRPLSTSLVDDYSIMVESLGKVGNVERAEELFKEGLSTFGVKRLHQYHSLITVFLMHGKIQKAENLVHEMTKLAFSPGSSTFHKLIEVYAKKGDERKAMETLRKAQGANKVFAGHKPWHASYLTILEMFSDKGDFEKAELVLQEAKKTGYSCSFKMYSALLKAYANAKIMPKGFLDRMRADGVIPNSHIRKELERLMDNRREIYNVSGATRYLY